MFRTGNRASILFEINSTKTKEKKEVEIVRRLLEKGQNQRENIQENITDDILRHAIRHSRLRIGMDGVLRYVNYKGHSSSEKPFGKAETAEQVVMDRWVCQFGVPLAM